jgi:hypothetical protein
MNEEYLISNRSVTLKSVLMIPNNFSLYGFNLQIILLNNTSYIVGNSDITINTKISFIILEAVLPHSE